MTAYYNEIDPYAAQWLRNLIAAGHIAPGDVDERSIEDVAPDDLRGYHQCHFFAGIGVWSLALRRAGVSDDTEVWTGSCPCQPFSAAGKGAGFADERHLWPAFHWLIEQRRPRLVFGEQVASKDGLQWLDLVSADLEGTGYAVGAVDSCAAGFGAPHIRQRLYWVADNNNNMRHSGLLRESAQRIDDSWENRRALAGFERSDTDSRLADGSFSGCGSRAGLRDIGAPGFGRDIDTDSSSIVRLADADDQGPQGRVVGRNSSGECALGSGGVGGGLADAAGSGRGEERPDVGRQPVGDRAEGFSAGLGSSSSDCRPRPTDGFWRDADWLFCRDGKWRPVEPGTFPLAHGAPARVGRLRAYGNAIVAPQAEAFVRAYLETRV